ncbi:MAG TPA: zinc-dependent peptidase [Candidatus Hydrogenedentes bacterium]|nr:zinc-dependent peptidase [Candidatus Hydrogenedentota bacterium]HQH52395.1 zinc-dependent peptidase [Candidatus Hydrogenedentota bacterium]
MFALFKNRRRRNLRAGPFPDAWVTLLQKNVPYYRCLPWDDQHELQQHIKVFLGEKHFEGCRGIPMTDEIRVTVAGQACVLLLHRDTDYFPSLVTVLVYPSAFVVKTVVQRLETFAIHGEEEREGEAWQRGVVVLAWDSVHEGFRHPHDGQNVILHEFAHQLDLQDGDAEGFPPDVPPALRVRWGQVLSAAYRKLCSDVDRGRPGLLDPYGATNPAEFFAVVTEYFFECPDGLKRSYPDMYDVFREYYRQDPAALYESRKGKT